MDAHVRNGTPPIQGAPANPPAFNVPRIVLALIAALVFVHLWRMQLLSASQDTLVILDYAFIAGCYRDLADFCQVRPDGADYWSPVTHAFLHGDWTHLAANCAWLLAFGTPVARRLHTVRFLVFCLLGALAGAGLFYVVNPTIAAPMIGASGVVSAVMGGAARFALGRFGRLGNREVALAPRLTVLQSLSDRTVLFFVGIFFATNLLLGSGLGSAFGGGPIAWEAHLGGFALGFLGFAFFDPRPPRR
ncbi:rhomboid family intramembrane serine protease [Aureimonas populi]|uniref:Rhomboid family intramembrane serine protease n=1 Tax=Aureimonas populi TaxID=1701758 RepID=A0ABW5CRK5_9HYPH|nr:rhomboid family intramembrane serine protease [Aureimonas populi]